jgi:hypothetical protein
MSFPNQFKSIVSQVLFGLVYGIYRHFQQYFSFIVGGNW